MSKAQSHLMPFSTHHNTITINVSDGDSKRWPDLGPRGDCAEGDLNHYIPADAKIVKYWKQKVATFLVKEANLIPHAPGQQFILSDFPTGYRLFTHLKGDKSNPRKDHYLFGSKLVVAFRSPAEFFLHAKWLTLDCPVTRDWKPLCACKYCGDGVKQSEISKVWSNWSPSINPASSRTEDGPMRVPFSAPNLQVRDYSGRVAGVGGAVWRCR